MKHTSLVLIIAALAISGCTSTSPYTESNFRETQKMLRTNPKAKRAVIEMCIKNGFGAKREEMAAIMHVSSASNVEQIYCTRLMNAMASGRYTYADYLAQKRSPGLTAKSISVIQG